MDIIEKIAIAEKNLQRALDWNDRFNTRSSVIIGIDAGMIGALAIITKSSQLFSYFGIFIFFSLLLEGTSLIMISLGEYPHTKGPEDSLTYFGTVAMRDEKEVKNQFLELSEEEYLNDLLEQYWVNSKILNLKFKFFKAALLLLLLSIFPWTISLFIA